VKLTDFGFSVMVVDPNKRLKIFCGTPSYMAPEITQRREYHGRPVDVWSLGVLLYAMVAGHFPFTAKTYPELYKKIAAGVFKTPDHFSPALVDLLRRLLNAEPTKRLTLGHAKLHPWCAFAMPAVMAAIAVPQQHSLLISADPADDLVEAVLARAAQLGFKRQMVVEAVLGRHKSAISTSYYLLLSRMGRGSRLSEGGGSGGGSGGGGGGSGGGERGSPHGARGEEGDEGEGAGVPAGRGAPEHYLGRGAGAGAGAPRTPAQQPPHHPQRPSTAMPSSTRGTAGVAAPSPAMRAAALTGASAPITGLLGGAPGAGAGSGSAPDAPAPSAPLVQRSRTNSTDGGEGGAGALLPTRNRSASGGGGGGGGAPPSLPASPLLSPSGPLGEPPPRAGLGDSPPGAGTAVVARSTPRPSSASRPNSASRPSSASGTAPPRPQSASRPSSAGAAAPGGLLTGIQRASEGEDRSSVGDAPDGGGGGGGVLFSLPPQRSRRSSRVAEGASAAALPLGAASGSSSSSGGLGKSTVAAAAPAAVVAPPPQQPAAGATSFLERVAAHSRHS